MKVSTASRWLFLTLGVLLTSSTLPAAWSPPQVDQLTQGPNVDVIVLLRDQVTSVPPMRGDLNGRKAVLSSVQGSVVGELHQSGATRIHGFGLINALATTLPKAQIARLSAHPMVQAVVPDLPIHAIRRTDSKSATATGGGVKQAMSGSISSKLCNTLEPEALQLTNTAFLDTTVPQAQQVRDGNGKLITGQGVKVAWIADGLDPTVAGFTHTDGSPVFFDYEDFSGDPATTPTQGGEAFGDASSIAAQDTPNGVPLFFDISKFVAKAHALPSPCKIRIRGMAPGATIAGLKAFSNLALTTTSGLVQAIEWAVMHDQVDVINESFGGNPFTDNDDDPISLANNAAVRAGVTVVVATGDAGTNGTLGSPSTNSDVIAAGATNQWRTYAQTGGGAIPLTAERGYINNNVSAFSSGGFSQTGPRTVDVVAPGDSGWALCSTNPVLFTDCTSNAGTATPIEDFGGTSESSPLIAGEAALVIQAYRSTHHGLDPTPAIVKQIIMSTATDLGAPSTEQGAGLINSLAAVNAALSYDLRNRQGESVLTDPTSANAIDQPYAFKVRHFTITNTGTTTQQLTPTLQMLGPPFASASKTLTLKPSRDPTFPNVTGAPRSYILDTFRVPAGAQHLDAAIAFNPAATATGPPIVYFALVDPEGRQAAYSIPQGFGSGYGQADVVAPLPGIWTIFVWTRPPGVSGSYAGPVLFSWAVENYTTFGTLTPAHLTLAPGASTTLTATFEMPAAPGDVAAAIRFSPGPNASGVGHAEIPVLLRTLIPVGPNGGTFTGTLTGGNGRNGAGPTQTFAFDVPTHLNNMSVSLTIPDSGWLLEGLLVDPSGMQVSVEPNLAPDGSALEFSLQQFRFNPKPGRWRFVLLQNFSASGNETSLPFTARISFFTNAQIEASGIPDSAGVKLSASKGPVTIPVLVTNNGAGPQWYFFDARLNNVAALPLTTALFPQFCPYTQLLGACFQTIVPPEINTVKFTAQASVPIQMDAYNLVGYNVGGTFAPDLWALPSGKDKVAASLSVPEVPFGPWVIVPATIGPYPAAGAPMTENVTTSAVAYGQEFDASVSADSGDAWTDLVLGTMTFNPLLLDPGQSGIINVTFTPDPKAVGHTVSGFLYLDTYNLVVGSGDEVARIPYSYTITK